MWHETNNDDRSRLVHDIVIDNERIKKYTKLQVTNNKGVRVDRIAVNSIHHQAVKDIPVNAVSIAEYKPFKDKHFGQDVTNEALLYLDHKIASVQYHPEEINDALAFTLIQYLLS